MKINVKLLVMLSFMVVLGSGNSYGQEKSIRQISDESLTMLYESEVGSPLYIPKKELINPDGSPINVKQLEELFKKYDIQTRSRYGYKQEDISILLNRAEKEKEPGMSSLDQLPGLLSDAKILLKSFLIKNDSELPYIEQNFIRKEKALRRLFTYAKLQRVIEDKKLLHIRLPSKVLVIKDLTTNRYVSSAETARIIDDILKMYVSISPNLFLGAQFNISYPTSSKYELFVFAHKEENEGIGFSKKTMQELFTLCQDAPFDIGYGNIFHDSKGDAIIIDTEYKETTKEDCGKLYRYPINPSL